MYTRNLAVIFLLVSGDTFAQETEVERGTLCASFKMYAFDRPDIDFLNRKRKIGKIPAVDPDPSWQMTEIRGSNVERSAKRVCGSTDKNEIIECCFERGSPVELTVVEGRSKCVGLLGPMDPDMPVELLDRIASKMMACDRRKSTNPPISIFGQTIEKKWRNLTRKWMNTRKYKIESWGPEEETHDARRCYDVVGLPEAAGKPFDYKHADAMSWEMLRPDGSVLCASNNYRKHGNTFRGRVTECCNIAGRKTTLRLKDASWGKAGWGSGYIRFMDMRIHNRSEADKGSELKRKEKKNQPKEDGNENPKGPKDIVFMWANLKSFKDGRRNANAGCGPGEVPQKGGGCRQCTEKDQAAVNKDGSIKYPQCQTVQNTLPATLEEEETTLEADTKLSTVEEFCELLISTHDESICNTPCVEIKADYTNMLPEGTLDVCDGTGMTIAAVCPEDC